MMVLQSYISISTMSVLSLYKCSHDGVTKLHFYLHYVCIESLQMFMMVLQSYISISIMSVLSLTTNVLMMVLQMLHFYLHYVCIESLQMFS